MVGAKWLGATSRAGEAGDDPVVGISERGLAARVGRLELDRFTAAAGGMWVANHDVKGVHTVSQDCASAESLVATTDRIASCLTLMHL